MFIINLKCFITTDVRYHRNVPTRMQLIPHIRPHANTTESEFPKYRQSASLVLLNTLRIRLHFRGSQFTRIKDWHVIALPGRCFTRVSLPFPHSSVLYIASYCLASHQHLHLLHSKFLPSFIDLCPENGIRAVPNFFTMYPALPLHTVCFYCRSMRSCLFKRSFCQYFSH